MKKEFDVISFISGKEDTTNADKNGYDTVKYEGLLCSSNDVENGKKIYFSVDLTGKAIKSMIASPFTTPNRPLRFSIAIKEPKTVPVPTGKKSVVEVIRHVRYRETNFSFSAKGGATFLCILNYITNIVTVYPAFCSEDDNFNKQEGIKQSHDNWKRDMGFRLQLAELSNDYTLTTSILNELEQGQFVWTSKAACLAFYTPLKRILAHV